MENPLGSIRLTKLPLPLKVLVTCFLLLMGAGYLVSMLNLYLTYSLVDGKPGVSPDDLKRAFYGDRKRTMLAAKIDGGSMEQFLPNPVQKNTILNWIQDGAKEADFHAKIQPILKDRCVRCHNPMGVMSYRSFIDYKDVKEVVKVDRGEPVQFWARVAHSHIQAFALMFLCFGIIFYCTRLSERIKGAVIVLPFAAVLMDFGTRALAKLNPNFVYGVMLGGALLGISFAVMILMPLYEMWVKREASP